MDIEDAHSFQNFLQFVQPQRLKLVDIIDNISKETFPLIRLRMHRIFGRKAFNRKNNIFVSENKQLIYSAGTSIVEIHLHDCINKASQKSSELRQHFLLPEESRVAAEVSVLALSPNKKDLCFATIERNSFFKLMDITTHAVLKTFVVFQLVTPL